MKQNNSLFGCLERHYALQLAAGENFANFQDVKQYFSLQKQRFRSDFECEWGDSMKKIRLPADLIETRG